MPSKKEHKLISKNRSAHHEYFIDETIECGVELAGAEVKSIRERACQITDTFAIIRGGECWLVGLHIHPYSNGGVWNRDPDRRKKLLLHRKEIDYLDGKLRNRGYALVPLELYFNDSGRVKLLLGLGRGKKLYDKRESSAKRDAKPVKQMTKLEKLQLIDKLEKQMKEAAKMLEFELAAALRDQIIELRGETQKKK